MVPTPAEVARTRYYLRVAMRSIGCLLVVYALWEAASAFTTVLRGALLGEIVELVGFVVRLVMGVAPSVSAGIALIVLAARLARWLAPLPSARCPQCDYPLVGVVDGRCPECGLVMTPGQPPAPRPVPRAVPRPPAG